MEESKIDFDISSLNLDELIKTYENITAFLAYLEESKMDEGEDKNE